MLKFLLSRIEALECRAAVKEVAEKCFALAHAVLYRVPFGPRCPVCGAMEVSVYRPVVGEELAQQWGLSPEWIAHFNGREGRICVACGSSLRVKQLARVLLGHFAGVSNRRWDSVHEAVQSGLLPPFKIAEINSCGALHKFLAGHAHLSYSEFEPSDARIRHENFMALSYPPESFDIVLHSDTLEHVPDLGRALGELWRVLKPGGVSVFSVPIVRDGRATVERARLEQGQVVHLMEPSYHGGSYQTTRQYLVFHEFGEDFTESVRMAGFEVSAVEVRDNPSAITFLARKPEGVGGDKPVGGREKR